MGGRGVVVPASELSDALTMAKLLRLAREKEVLVAVRQATLIARTHYCHHGTRRSLRKVQAPKANGLRLKRKKQRRCRPFSYQSENGHRRARATWPLEPEKLA